MPDYPAASSADFMGRIHARLFYVENVYGNMRILPATLLVGSFLEIMDYVWENIYGPYYHINY
jgi:hypothetical protein